MNWGDGKIETFENIKPLSNSRNFEAGELHTYLKENGPDHGARHGWFLDLLGRYGNALIISPRGAVFSGTSLGRQFGATDV